MNMQFDTEINAPADQVFRQATDFENASSFVSGIESVEMLTEGPVGVGTRFKETRVIFNKKAVEEMEITEIEAGKMVSLGCESCGCRYDSRFDFQPIGEGRTRVTLRMESTALTTGAKIMGAITAPLMKGTMRKMLERDMADLRRACEEGPVSQARGQAGS